MILTTNAQLNMGEEVCVVNSVVGRTRAERNVSHLNIRVPWPIGKELDVES